MSWYPRARVSRLSKMRLSAAPGPLSPSSPRSAGRAIANGSVVWHEMQNVPWSRAALGHVDQNVARLSRYAAAACGLQPSESFAPAPGAAPPRTPHATNAVSQIPRRVINFMAGGYEIGVARSRAVAGAADH